MGVPGKTGLIAFLTDITCGEACWEAREDICRCSCGGKNHGVLRDPNGKRPERTAKLDGYSYKLTAVGETGIYDKAEEINKAAGPYRVDKVNDDVTYRYFYRDTDRGAPARVKPANASQIERWAELTAWRDKDSREVARHRPYLLWERFEMKTEIPPKPAIESAQNQLF